MRKGQDWGLSLQLERTSSIATLDVDDSYQPRLRHQWPSKNHSHILMILVCTHTHTSHRSRSNDSRRSPAVQQRRDSKLHHGCSPVQVLRGLLPFLVVWLLFSLLACHLAARWPGDPPLNLHAYDSFRAAACQSRGPRSDERDRRRRRALRKKMAWNVGRVSRLSADIDRGCPRRRVRSRVRTPV